MRICTIVARNYLAYARVLATSFREQHPAGECFVLVIDDVAGEVDDSTEPFRIVRPSDLPLQRFEAMAAMYDVTELATAVKPWLLEHLLAEGGEAPISYFDPDIRFYAPVEEIAQQAIDHELVLIPHITAPLPDDGQQPGELVLMASGTYNLGFVAMAPSARVHELLGWWQRHLRYDCVVDHALGYFVDQRWFDLVPNTFDGTAVLRDPGMNVAYWNLHERELTRDATGRWFVNDQPLRFFHFSGFNPREPHLLSKHQTRTRLSDHPELARLCADFARDVEAHERKHERDAPYGWATLGDGRIWTQRLRRLYRAGEREGAFHLSPFEPAGAREFLDWLNEPAPDDTGASTVSRYWLDVYKERKDLQIVFPRLGEEAAAFAKWVESFGGESGDLRGLLPNDNDPLATLEKAKAVHYGVNETEPWGVNVGGFLQSELGIGEAARGLISGLDAARIPVLPVHGSWRPNSRQEHRYAMFDTADAAFPINIVCVNADVLEDWAAQAGHSFFAERYTIGFWWWEVLAFPHEWLTRFDLVDEVWVASQHVADALTPVSSVPVTKVTLPVSVPAVMPRSRFELGLPEGFLFMFLFDHHSIFDRKNPLATIEAFKRAFPPGSGAKLVIKSINHEYHRDEHERLLLAADHPDVYVIDRYVSASEKNSMIASADCYVSLHRSEGFGLTPAEALGMGKPVLATRYGGNLDFMNDRNSWLVDYRLMAIGPGQEPYPAEGEWADPDIEQAARYMREIYERPVAALERAHRGAREMRERHSPQAGGHTMQRRLEHIYGRRDRWPRRAPQEAAQEPNLAQLEQLVQGGPRPRSRSPFGLPARLLRRVVLRLIKPFTAYQQMVNSELLKAAREIARSAGKARRDLRAERGRTALRTAAQLGELRRQAAHIEELSEQLLGMRSVSSDEAMTEHVIDDPSATIGEAREALRGLEG